MKNPFLKISGILVAVIGFAVFSRGASALTLIPPTIEFSAKPGQELKQDIKLFNESNNPVILYASTANFAAKDEVGQPGFNFNQTPEDLASWVQVTHDPISIAPQATAKVSISISVPANADPGGHYAGVFFGTSPKETTPSGGQVKVLSTIGTLVILRVEGDVREAGSVEEFSAAGSKLPATFVLRVKNTGNVHFRPKGFITVRNMFGGVTATLPVNEVAGAVLPNSIRRFEMVWKKNDTKLTTGGFFSQVGAEWRNFAMGTYTAEAQVTYGQSNQTMSASTRVTVMPWELLIVLGLGVVVVILLIVWMVKNYNAMIIRRVQSQMSAGSGKNPPSNKK